MATVTKPRTQRERIEASTRALLEAAVELIAANGFQRTTTAQISCHAGFSNAMLHVRFRSKEGLLEALLAGYERELFVDPGPGESGLESIMHQIDLCRTVVRERPDYLRALCMLAFEMVGPDNSVRPQMIEWRHRYLAHTAELIRAGQADGSIRAEIDPAGEAQIFQDFISGLCFRWTLDPETVDMIAELDAWAQRLSVWLGAN